MQLIKNMQFRILMALSILGVIFGSCDSLIYEDLEDCPQGVYVKFYSMTPCDADSTFLGAVGKLSLFAFDEQGVLAATHEESNAILTQSYEVLMPVRHGTYTFVAWAGLNDKFDVSTFTVGKTTREDVMMTLKFAGGEATQLGQDRVYQGESRAVSLSDPAIFGTEYKYTAVNLREVTNRIRLIVEVEQENYINELPDANKLDVLVQSANGTMNIDGTIKHNEAVLEYPARDTDLTSAASAEWNFTLLDLVSQGLSNMLKITLDNSELSEEPIDIFKEDLIATILRKPLNPELAPDKGGVKLECENDFDIKLRIIDRCVDCETFFSCEVYVNDWLVHTYGIELEIY